MADSDLSRQQKQRLQRGRQWYVIQAYSGHEDAVKTAIEQAVESLRMQDRVFSVFIPRKTEIEYRGGEPIETRKNVFPGYIFVEMIVDDETWFAIRNAPNVTGFVGTLNTPVPVSPEEMAHIRSLVGDGAKKHAAALEKGDLVKVTEGPFAGYEGNVAEVDSDKGKVTVEVSLFGRTTPVELSFPQVRKV